ALGVSKQEHEGSTSSASIKSLSDDIVVPAIELDVERLQLYGREIGRLRLAGDSASNEQAWQINTLKLTGDGAQLDGSGLWRLAGPKRGLSVSAQVAVSDAGAYFDQIKLDDVLQGGSGEISGKLEWLNFPWGFERADLDGTIRLS